MSKIRLIGLTGRKRHGKDSAYSMLKEMLVGRAHLYRFSFADALKQEVAEALGLSVYQIEQEKEKYRPILQWWGTQWRRSQDPLYWIKQMERKLEFAHHFCDTGIITDVRFPNEADMVRRHNGLIVRVIRPCLESTDTHESETAMDHYPVDKVLVADNLDGLRLLVETFNREVLSQIPFPNV